jgi:putative tricarboxylic transport membrane protein
VPVRYIAPFVAVLSFIGVYAVRSNIWDVLLAVVAAIVGFGLRKAGFPIITLVIGFVLGELAEKSFVQSLQIAGGSYSIFFSRPVSIILILLILGTLAYNLYKAIKANGASKAAQG